MAEDSYIFPLSFAQQRLWLLDRIAPGNPFYNIPLAIPIAAYLDLRALEKALNAIVARHESLRTTFRVVDNEPVQLVHPKLELTISITDLSSLSAAELRTREVELATAEARKPFDLEQGPLIRCGVIVRGWTDYILLITTHHIVSDGWSMGIFMQELTVFYQSFCINYPIKLPDLPVQYPDFAVWQRDWLKGEVLETQLGYWREHLRDLPVLELPTDHPRPLYSSYKGSSYPVRLGYALSHQVRKFASSHGVTPFMVLLSVFAAVLQRYSGHEEIVIGIPVANRTRTELEGLIGFFVNSLVLRIDLKGDPSFSEIVDRVREVSLAAYAHQDLPFEKLVEELHPSRDPSRNPLFQVTFQLINTPSVQDISSSENSTTIHVQRGSAIFDLAFSLLDGATEFSGIFEYSTDLFDQTTIARIERHFRQLLQSAVANPNDSFASLPMLSRAEEDELLKQSRGPELELPAQPFVHRLIAAQAGRTPDAVAVRSGASELRYRELMQQSTKLANYLRGRGVETEQCVGILMDRSIDLVVALLGVLEAGAVYLPLDPAYPVERLRYMLADSGAKVILTQSGQPLIPELASEKVDVVVMDQAGWRADSDAQPSLPVELSPNNLCYVLYTSGSTGRPKGVSVPHSALTNHMQWMAERFPLTETDRVLQRTPYSFDASIWEFFAPLMAGAT
ncbi:MAG TPA: condensation domain-containing protein, partial [Pyrinomonadaceae bacterium]|nr:condensation domain-containing protein [Pyrinomonadaceae bacterium]